MNAVVVQWERIESPSAMPTIARLLSGEGGAISCTAADRQRIAIAQCQDGAYAALVTGDPDDDVVEHVLWATSKTVRDDDSKANIRITRHLLVPEATLAALYDGAPNKAVIQAGESEISTDIDRLFAKAIAQGASDIFINGGPASAIVRIRRDGLVVKIDEIESDKYERIARAMFLMCSEKSRDGDFSTERSCKGSFVRSVGSRRLSFRFQSRNTHPDTIDLEIRALPQYGESKLTFRGQGYEPKQIEVIQEILNRPHGIVATAGATGSGKSTLLKVACEHLAERYDGEARIVSLEDPVEYTIEGVRQTNVSKPGPNQTKNEMWQQALEDLMRANPDIVMLGEIRSPETAKEALQIAFTGHKLLTSIHLNTPFALYQRFEQFGIPPQDLATTGFVNGIVRQALVPSLCAKCSIPLHEAPREAISDVIVKALTNASPERDSLKAIRLRNKTGCDFCGGIGTVGRTVVAEIMVPDATMNKYVAAKDYDGALALWSKGQAGHLRNGSSVYTMLEHALVKVFRGQVDPRHVDRTVANLRVDTVTQVTPDEIAADGFGADA